MDEDSEVHKRLKEVEDAALPQSDFIKDYLDYLGYTESPTIFNRWSAIGGLGAWLSQSVWFEHGDNKIFPNLYIQLFGLAGARKSTAIKSFTKILREAGFDKFSVEKTSKEKFIDWLAEQGQEEESGVDILEQSLWSTLDSQVKEGAYTTALIAADEFNDFFAANILEFISFLGTMWDNKINYTTSTRIGGVQVIPSPCISILSGNTPTTFAKSIPPEIIGQGFFSRMILVHSDPTGIKIAFPKPGNVAKREELITRLKEIKDKYQGPIKATPEAIDVLTRLYETWAPIDDARFESYGQRRFDQLIKLCLIHTVTLNKESIDTEVVVKANTVLHRTEMVMPKALGEFGRSKFATVIHKIMIVLDAAHKPMDLQDLWERLYQDLDKMQDLSEIMKNLLQAKKVQILENGFLPLKQVQEDYSKSEFLDWNYLTKQEREVVI